MADSQINEQLATQTKQAENSAGKKEQGGV